MSEFKEKALRDLENEKLEINKAMEINQNNNNNNNVENGNTEVDNDENIEKTDKNKKPMESR